jgi:hypothetical protein
VNLFTVGAARLGRSWFSEDDTMHRIARAFAAAAAILILGSAAHALDLNRPPFELPNPTIEPGVIDPTNPCVLHPELCEPQNPCEEFPELCQPEPPDPCEANPILCNPIDLCEIAPQLCSEDPPVLEPADPTPNLFGGAIVRADGQKVAESFVVELSFDTTAKTFSMIDGESGAIYTGNLAPKGKSGRKFTLFLDDPSKTEFVDFVASRGAAAAGSPAGSVLGDTTKIVLKLDETGAIESLKIKSQVLTSGVGEVVYKTNMTPTEDQP